jgi:hypothetical protein
MSIKLINKDKKQLAVFVPQHFSQQFFPIIRALAFLETYGLLEVFSQ